MTTDKELSTEVGKMSDLYKGNFLNAVIDTEKLLEVRLDDPYQFALSRLLFSSAITALELYLGSVFLSCVSANPETLDRLLASGVGVAGQSKFKQGQIEEARSNAMRELEATSWHNLGRARKLYSAALDIELPATPRLDKFVRIRHDLVHRNGFTPEGNEWWFSREEVANLLQLVEAFVQDVDQRVMARELL